MRGTVLWRQQAGWIHPQFLGKGAVAGNGLRQERRQERRQGKAPPKASEQPEVGNAGTAANPWPAVGAVADRAVSHRRPLPPSRCRQPWGQFSQGPMELRLRHRWLPRSRQD